MERKDGRDRKRPKTIKLATMLHLRPPRYQSPSLTAAELPEIERRGPLEIHVNPNDNTPLILDLRDRMARIETKLDVHNETHRLIDRRLDTNEADIEYLKTEVATGKAKVATAGAIGGGVFALLGFLGDRFWNIFN